MKWIKLFESFTSADKIQLANKIHAAFVVAKFLDKSGLSILKGTREEHLASGSYTIQETYYYKKKAGVDKLLICLVEGGMWWDPYGTKIVRQRLVRSTALNVPNKGTLCMDKSFRTSLLQDYLKKAGIVNHRSAPDRMFWEYCEYAVARYFNFEGEKIEFFPIKLPSLKNFEKLISGGE